MSFLQLSERALLDALFGNVVGQVNQTITAPAAATTSITVRGSSGSGNMDITAVSGQVFVLATPGSNNTYSNMDIVTATSGSTGTSLAITSQTIGKSRAVGDLIFLAGPNPGNSNQAPHYFIGTWYVGLSTVGAQTTIAAGSDLATLPTTPINVASTTGFPASGNLLIISETGWQNVAYTGGGGGGTQFTGCTGGTGTIDTGDVVLSAPTSATVLSNEPTSTGGYARVAVTNNAANFGAATGANPASKTNATQISFPQSSAAWSSGATNLDLVFLADASTLAGGNVLYWGYLTNPQTVNASGITPSFAASALTLTLL